MYVIGGSFFFTEDEMKIVLKRNSTRATTYLGRINIVPGVHVYAVSDSDWNTIKTDDFFVSEVHRKEIEIVSENCDDLSPVDVAEIAKTASAAELDLITPNTESSAEVLSVAKKQRAEKIKKSKLE